MKPGHKSVVASFHPSHCHCGTIEDFLSSNRLFFEDAYHTDPEVTLYAVELLRIMISLSDILFLTMILDPV